MPSFKIIQQVNPMVKQTFDLPELIPKSQSNLSTKYSMRVDLDSLVTELENRASNQLIFLSPNIRENEGLDEDKQIKQQHAKQTKGFRINRKIIPKKVESDMSNCYKFSQSCTSGDSTDQEYQNEIKVYQNEGVNRDSKNISCLVITDSSSEDEGQDLNQLQNNAIQLPTIQETQQKQKSAESDTHVFKNKIIPQLRFGTPIPSCKKRGLANHDQQTRFKNNSIQKQNAKVYQSRFQDVERSIVQNINQSTLSQIKRQDNYYNYLDSCVQDKKDQDKKKDFLEINETKQKKIKIKDYVRKHFEILDSPFKTLNSQKSNSDQTKLQKTYVNRKKYNNTVLEGQSNLYTSEQSEGNRTFNQLDELNEMSSYNYKFRDEQMSRFNNFLDLQSSKAKVISPISNTFLYHKLKNQNQKFDQESQSLLIPHDIDRLMVQKMNQERMKAGFQIMMPRHQSNKPMMRDTIGSSNNCYQNNTKTMEKCNLKKLTINSLNPVFGNQTQFDRLQSKRII
ncbi:UNKNOWN [Stylonychia lemnae]|uniref:Uncharacterized protein n=1 Tax=Stylonychia lemnae TaxID=5949 RepID=A0A077ZUT3_STYLE|nr:UNKNOWN [Stylonychia lemnae]|eukprot:CDW73065.1 UNKNOWN [Stylonychia lemnae]